MLRFFETPCNSVKFCGSIGASLRLDRAVLFPPMVEGALGDVQLLAELPDGLTFLVTADHFDFEFCRILHWHNLNSFFVGWDHYTNALT